ncbi:MAG: YjgP/YjgQ family permease [Acidobacteriota bacterium]|jgi:lipopolysaccharide export system permease protein
MRILRHRFILSRGILRETLPSFLLATGVTTFLLLVRAIFLVADLLVQRSVPLAVVGRMLLYSVPHVLVLTIPIGVLFAALMTVARLAADSEIVALQASGVRLARVAVPLLFFGGVMFLANLVLSAAALAPANRNLQLLTLRIALSGFSAAVEPGVFSDDFPGQLLYVKRINRDTRRWQGVLLFDLTNPIEERVVVADSGDLVINPADGTAWLNLRDTTSHVLRPDDPTSYQQTANRELRIFLAPPATAPIERRLGARQTDTEELLERARNPEGHPMDRQEARIELHKRAAIPAASLVFAALAVPLGLGNRRGGKGYGLTVSVLIVVVYYILLNNGQVLAVSGKLPIAVGMWLANLVGAAIAAGLLLRMSRRFAVGRRSWVVAVREWWRELRMTRRRRIAPTVAGRPVVDDGPGEECQRQGTEDGEMAAPFAPFTGIIDRLVLRQCVSFLILVILAISAIFVAVKLSDIIDDVQRHHVPFTTVVSYLLFSLPQILRDILPLSFLIAFLGTAAILERHNESVALKAAGVSLTRVTMPLFVLALVLGAGLFVLDDSFVHQANRAEQALLDTIKGRKVARSFRATYHQWLFLPDGRTLVNFIQYDPDTDTLLRPSVYVFDDNLNLRARHMAAKASWRDGEWRAEGAWSRTFLASGSPVFVRHADQVAMPIAVEPSYFGREYRKPSQMSFAELRSYILTLRAAGYKVDRFRVRLHDKITYPLSIALLAWLALPFAFRIGRRGAVMGIGLALVLGMSYFALMAIVGKLGESSLLSPPLAAWTPTVIFALLAINRHTTLQT